MFTEEGLEMACDELAEVIDAKEGEIDVADLLGVLILRICSDDKSVNAEILRAALLRKFDEIFCCNPFVYAENSKDDVQWNSDNPVLDTDDDLEPFGFDEIFD